MIAWWWLIPAFVAGLGAMILLLISSRVTAFVLMLWTFAHANNIAKEQDNEIEGIK